MHFYRSISICWIWNCLGFVLREKKKSYLLVNDLCDLIKKGVKVIRKKDFFCRYHYNFECFYLIRTMKTRETNNFFSNFLFFLQRIFILNFKTGYFSFWGLNFEVVFRSYILKTYFVLQKIVRVDYVDIYEWLGIGLIGVNKGGWGRVGTHKPHLRELVINITKYLKMKIMSFLQFCMHTLRYDYNIYIRHIYSYSFWLSASIHFYMKSFPSICKKKT